MRHSVVYHNEAEFAAWPANGGLWSWDDGDEAVIGFIVGDYEEMPGHNIREPYRNVLARTTDGGESWDVDDAPTGFCQPNDSAILLEGPIRFHNSDVAIRFVGIGYHASTLPGGGFVVSEDRAWEWRGPFALTGLADEPSLADYEEITARTDAIFTTNDKPNAATVFLSARKPNVSGSDRTFVARTTDGGQHFSFVSWIGGPDDAYRAVMPATVFPSPTHWITTLRRRKPDVEENWIDCYESRDEGQSWQFLSRVAETGVANGNPPALVAFGESMKTHPPRLCCVYGHRTPDAAQIQARMSDDGGQTWSTPKTLRDDYQPDRFGDLDLGYPRVFERKSDGALVAIYYWCSAGRPQGHLAATIWKP